MTTERRHADRAAVRLEARLEQGESTSTVTLGNLGPAGAFVETPEDLKIGSRFELTFPLLPFRNSVTVEAEVRWRCGGNRSGVGVHFKNLRELDQLAIHDFVLILLARRRHEDREG